jgi:hypothetical protein
MFQRCLLPPSSGRWVSRARGISSVGIAGLRAEIYTRNLQHTNWSRSTNHSATIFGGIRRLFCRIIGQKVVSPVPYCSTNVILFTRTLHSFSLKIYCTPSFSSDSDTVFFVYLMAHFQLHLSNGTMICVRWIGKVLEGNSWPILRDGPINFQNRLRKTTKVLFILTKYDWGL